MTNEVAVSMKIFLEDYDRINETMDEINKIIKISDTKIEELGFGIKILKIIFLMPDTGGIDEIETQISALSNIRQAQTERVSRI
ncbi:MAG: hypothetical protein AB1391_02435 [Candidatus Micrarchaeota archaeon]